MIRNVLNLENKDVVGVRKREGGNLLSAFYNLAE